MSIRTPETLITRLLDEEYSEILKIDDTLQRSTRIIQDSINLTNRTNKRKSRSNSKHDRSFEYIPREQDIVPKSSPQIGYSRNLENQSFIVEKNKDMPFSSLSYLEEKNSWKSQNSQSSFLSDQKETQQIKEREEYEAKIAELMNVLKRETDLKLKSEQELRYLNLKNKEMRESEKYLKNQIENLTELLKKSKIEGDHEKGIENNTHLESNNYGLDKNASEMKDSMKNQKIDKVIITEFQIKELEENHKIEIMQLKDQILELTREKTIFELRYNNLFSLHTQSENYEIIQNSIEKTKEKNIKDTCNTEENKNLDYQQTIERLESHILNIEKKLNYQIKVNKKLEKELNLLHKKEIIASDAINIDIQRSTSKISDLEEKVQKMTSKYEKLKLAVINNCSRSASVNSFSNHISQDSHILKSDLSKPHIQVEKNKSCINCKKKSALLKHKNKK